MTIPEWMPNMPKEFIAQIRNNHKFMFLPEMWYKKLEVAPRNDRVVFKRMHKSVLDRVIDLQTFYSIVTGKQATEIHVGYRELGEIKKETMDCVAYSSPINGVLGKFIGMTAFIKKTSHHMEIK
jgi:hypothetical protein